MLLNFDIVEKIRSDKGNFYHKTFGPEDGEVLKLPISEEAHEDEETLRSTRFEPFLKKICLLLSFRLSGQIVQCSYYQMILFIE